MIKGKVDLMILGMEANSSGMHGNLAVVHMVVSSGIRINSTRHLWPQHRVVVGGAVVFSRMSQVLGMQLVVVLVEVVL
jgi:hypothetical protein